MGEAASRRRTRLLWGLGLVLLLAAVAVVAWRWDAEATSLPVGDEPASGAPAPGLLTAEGRPGEEEAPELATRPAAERGPAAGPVRVTVVGPGGAPLPGVVIARGDVGLRAGDPKTDARGVATLPDLPYDGSVTLLFHMPEPWRPPGTFVPGYLAARFERGKPMRVPVRGPEVRFVARTGHALRLHVVDADTSGAVEGVHVKFPKALGEADRAWHLPDHDVLVLPTLGKATVVGWTMKPPAGWVAWERSWCQATISPYAESLEYVMPLRREADVTVLARDDEGLATPARVTRVEVAGRSPGVWRAEADAYGRLRVFGVPSLRHEPLLLEVAHPDGSGAVQVSRRLPVRPDDPLHVEIVLPASGDSPAVSSSVAIGIGGGAGGAFGGRGGSRGPAVVDNTLVVRVLRRDGSPAIGAPVALRGRVVETDAEGLARFDRLPPSEYGVSVGQPGLLPMTGSVRVGPSGAHALTLRESQGGTIDLEVVDEEGRPLPFAEFALTTGSKLPWMDLRGTTQRLDRFADHLGTRLLEHVEPGPVDLRVTWGGRRTSRRVTVEEGGIARVRCVLAHEPPPR